MSIITTVEQLEELYGSPGAASLRKVADHITPEYRTWIEASAFCALATVGPEGADASPRGDRGKCVWELDEKTLLMPDRRGNNRMDSLRNIVRDGRVALMFLTQGSNTVTRVNGRAEISVDAELKSRFVVEGKEPRSLIVIHIHEVYFQCAKAVMRSGLWKQETWPDLSVLPSVGQILKSMSDGELGGAKYDAEYPARSKATMW